jgi:hypothetical protein
MLRAGRSRAAPQTQHRPERWSPAFGKDDARTNPFSRTAPSLYFTARTGARPCTTFRDDVESRALPRSTSDEQRRLVHVERPGQLVEHRVLALGDAALVGHIRRDQEDVLALLQRTVGDGRDVLAVLQAPGAQLRTGKCFEQRLFQGERVVGFLKDRVGPPADESFRTPLSVSTGW